MFKFGQEEVTAKEFYRQRQIPNTKWCFLIKCHAIMERTPVKL